MKLLNNAIRDIHDIVRDYSTLGGALVQGARNELSNIKQEASRTNTPYAIKNAFIRAAQNPDVQRTVKGAVAGGAIGTAIPILGTVGGAISGGMAGYMGGKNFINANLSPYNLTIDELKTLPSSEIKSRITTGAYNKPVTAALDFLSLGGTKLVKPVVKGVGETIGIVPSQTQKALFKDLNEALNASRVERNKLYNPVSELKSKPLVNRTNLVKYITLDDSKGLNKNDIELGNRIKSMLRDAEDTAVGNDWITKNEAKNNVVAQYIMGKYSKDNPNLLHAHIMDYLEGNKSNNIIPDTIKKDIDKAKGLYDNKRIAYLTQAIVNSYDPTGQVVARDVNKGAKDYFQIRRVIGRSMAEDIDRKLDQSLEYQMDKVYKGRDALNIANSMLSQYGRPVTKADKLKANEVVVKPEELKKVISKSFTDSSSKPIDQYLRSVGTVGEGIAIDRKLLNAVANALQDTKKVPFGTTMGIIKRTLLAQPHWFALNRVGNTTNNIMEGITPIDYIDTVKYKKYIPDQLKQQTSFNHFLTDEGKSSGPLAGSKAGITKMVNSVKNFNINDPKKFKKLATGLIEGSNEVVTEPIFKLESVFELQDRYANYIKQAKRYASAHNMKLEKVLKKAKGDSKLYNELNNRVNKTLGDYMGRNYNISPEQYAKLSLLVPFYRFLTQTARTTYHQLDDRGLAYQSLIGAPTKVGTGISNEIMNLLGIPSDEYEGGVPYKVSGTDLKGNPTRFRMMRTEPLPAYSVLQDLGKLLSGVPGEGIVSPLYTTAGDLIQGTKMGRPITTPYKEALSSIGIPYNIVQNTKLSPKERWKYIATTLADYVSSPYRLSHTYYPEAVEAFNRISPKIGRGKLKSRFDTDPYMEIPSSYTRQGIAELIGKWLGIQNVNQLMPYRQNIDTNTLLRNQMKYQNKLNY